MTTCAAQLYLHGIDHRYSGNLNRMILQDKNGFVLPDLFLSSLPTGAVKELVNTLGSRIATGHYEIGKSIPMEPELVAEHGVSRTVVREAIKVLSGKGLVRTARRYGTHVCDTDEWNLIDPDVIGWHEPDGEMVQKLFSDASQFRMLIEPHAAGLAAEKATQSQLDLIQLAAQAVDTEAAASDKRLAAEFAFHATVLEGSQNMMLRQFRGFLHAILSFANSTGQSGNASCAEVAKAIADRNSEKSASAMRALLSANT